MRLVRSILYNCKNTSTQFLFNKKINNNQTPVEKEEEMLLNFDVEFGVNLLQAPLSFSSLKFCSNDTFPRLTKAEAMAIPV